MGLSNKNSQALKNKIDFIKHHKAPVAIGAIGTLVLSITTVGDFLPPETQDNTLQVHVTPITQEDIEDIQDGFLAEMSPIDILWFRRWINSGDNLGQYRSMIKTFEDLDLNTDNLDHLYDEISTHRDLAIRIDLYFIDYWFVNRKLEELEEGHQDRLTLSIIEGFFNFRRRLLENQPSSPEKAVALELTNLTRDNKFLCDFNSLLDETNDLLADDGNRPDLLCKTHLFYTMRSHNGGLSPENTLILQQLEESLKNP